MCFFARAAACGLPLSLSFDGASLQARVCTVNRWPGIHVPKTTCTFWASARLSTLLMVLWRFGYLIVALDKPFISTLDNTRV